MVQLQTQRGHCRATKPCFPKFYYELLELTEQKEGKEVTELASTMQYNDSTAREL